MFLAKLKAFFQKIWNFFNKKQIKQKLLKPNTGTGQICLDMLGYDGQQLFPGKTLCSNELRTIPGIKEVTVPVGQEETLDYSNPHIWFVLGKKGEQYWTIRHKDKIYCPTAGTMNFQEYKKQFVAFVLQQFLLPFNGQELSETCNN